MTDRRCDYCGRWFTPRRKDQRFGSAACRQAEWMTTHAEAPRKRFRVSAATTTPDGRCEAFRAAQRAS